MRGILLACSSALVLAMPAQAAHYFEIEGTLTDGTNGAPDLDFHIEAYFPDYAKGVGYKFFSAFADQVDFTLSDWVNSPENAISLSLAVGVSLWGDYPAYTWSMFTDNDNYDGFSFSYHTDTGEIFAAASVAGTPTYRWLSGSISHVIGEEIPYGDPVPEPTTWAMMIGGLALTGAAMRRRRYAVAFA